MTALLMDGFDQYPVIGTFDSHTVPASAPYVLAYFNVGAPGWGPARTGSQCAYTVTDNNNGLGYTGFGGTACYMSFGWAADSLLVSGITLLSLYGHSTSGNRVPISTLSIDSSGFLAWYDGFGTQVSRTSGAVFVPQRWYFIELSFNYGGSAFTIDVRVDDLDASGTPTLSATFPNNYVDGRTVDTLYLLSGFGTNQYVDDLFIRDNSGDHNNGWLGDRRISTSFVNSDVTTTGWVPSYMKKFGTGILRLGYTKANNTSPFNTGAHVRSAANSAFDLGSSDFTLETFIRFDTLPTDNSYASIFSRWDSSSRNLRSYRLIYGGPSFNDNCLQFDISTDGTAATTQTMIQYPWAPSVDTWYHVALVRVAGELLLFVDGVQLGLPITDTNTYFGGGAEVFAIGVELNTINLNYVTGSGLFGRLDETRLTNGVGRYTANFTPPSAAFPRNGTDDPDWTSVVLLMGYDVSVVDESSYNRTVSAVNGATQQTVNDGPDIGMYSTINEIAPNDHNFISANLTPATNILTMTTQPSNGDTVTVGTTDGTTAAVYKFVTSLSAAFDVLIGATAQDSLDNLLAAVNKDTGEGTLYGTGTTVNFDVTMFGLPAGQVSVNANIPGTAGNSIASTTTGTAATWDSTTLLGGTDIPSPSKFRFQKPPLNTTVISAVQLVTRAVKTDAGTAKLQTSLVGSGGGVASGKENVLALSDNYYFDIVETDPDTGSNITPSTLINGVFQLNRTQ